MEVWDYSKEHLRHYEPLFVGMNVRFRHVPFSWFPLVRISPQACGVHVVGLPDDSSRGGSPSSATVKHTTSV